MSVTVSQPLVFSSIENLQEVINSNESSLVTKNCVEDDFVSYAETVMEEEGYEDRLNPIYSEAFGSILNSEGEVYIGNVLLKLTDYGIFVCDDEYSSKLRNMEFNEGLLGNLSATDSFPIPVLTDDHKYIINGENIYFYDSFDMLSESNGIGNPKTKAMSSGKYLDDETRKILEFNSTFTFPKGKDQKHPFSSDSKVANDTKIYKQNYAVYSESGVKTKTMRKKLFWKKFTNFNESGIVNVYLESNITDKEKKSLSFGWVDINRLHFPGGRSINIASYYVKGNYSMPSSSKVNNDCSSALTWAKKEYGYTGDVDGICYIFSNSNKKCIALKDVSKSETSEKVTVQFNIDYSGTYNSKSSVSKILSPSENYTVKSVTFYGYSKYGNEALGSRLSFK